MNIFTTWLVAGLAAVLLTPLVRWTALSLAIVDHPGKRKIHKKPIPRLGGVAVFIAWLFALTLTTTFYTDLEVSFQLRSVIAIAFLVILFGAVDDWKDLGGKQKLLCQVALATMVYLCGIRIEFITNPMGGLLHFPWPLSYLMTVLWIVGLMNALNLIDGLDGLASGISIITCCGLIAAGLHSQGGVSVYILAALAGACSGFLVYNFHPAKIFLGDSGSQFLGFIFAVSALLSQNYKAATAVSLLVPLCALMIPIIDTALAFVRRIRGRKSVFRADKFHLHHRMIRMGLTQRQVVMVFYVTAIYLNCLAFLFVLIPERYALVLLFMLGLGLALSMQVMRFIEFHVQRRIRKETQLRRAMRAQAVKTGRAPDRRRPRS